MLGIIRSLRYAGQTGENEIESDNITGFLTKEDVQRPGAAAKRSAHRKESYCLWVCRSCDHSSFFAVVKCLSCESGNIEKVVMPSRYQMPASEIGVQ